MKLLSNLKAMLAPSAKVDPAKCFPRVRSGKAVLVDVREPSEWAAGVARGALLLPLSDLMGARARWNGALSGAGDRELVLYCAKGGRAGMAARVLASEGFRAVNAGGLGDWAAAGREVEGAAGKAG
jgi:rhodanese-related sulfurtransferase